LPTSYTKKRRIGSFKTDGSAHILAFTQNGDEFLWATTIADYNSITVGTTASVLTLSVPPGIAVEALFHGVANIPASSGSILFTSLFETDQAVSNYTRSLTTPSATVTAAADYRKRTNTSGQVRVRSDTGSTLVFVGTYGWIDPRGRFN
jgi:hypothetical protein